MSQPAAVRPLAREHGKVVREQIYMGDDDAYLYTPAIEALLRQTLRVAPSPDRIYLGAMSWFHWYPRVYERSGFGWSYTMAHALGSWCRNVTSAEERCKHRGCGADTYESAQMYSI